MTPYSLPAQYYFSVSELKENLETYRVANAKPKKAAPNVEPIVIPKSFKMAFGLVKESFMFAWNRCTTIVS